MSYCSSRFRTQRRVTREVVIGGVGVGGANPIRVQSMTTSDTQDVAATARQSIALAEVGCEIVRVTAPNVAAAKCLRDIRAQFTAAGFGHVPLVADIHFLPSAAMEAVEHVEKIRVNPGNYADKKRFAVREYTDADYERELERLHEAFSPLVKRCRELGRAMRIGTNHGSLSDRIMNRYGDTPLGMVESALEFIRIAQNNDFRDIVLSMKASNPKVMIQAYRLLVERMAAEDMHYPLHLGVTEAGDGEDGRIKSAIGIGSLLLDGLGDTIRVSLTEDSVYEIPVAQALARKAMSLWTNGDEPRNIGGSTSVWTVSRAGDTEVVPPANPDPESNSIDPYQFARRAIASVELGHAATINVEQPPRVIVSAGVVPQDMTTLATALRQARLRLVDTPIEGLLLRATTIEEANRAIAWPAAESAGSLPARAGLRDETLVECLIVELPPTCDTAALSREIGRRSPTAPRVGLFRAFDAAGAALAASFIRECAAAGALPFVALPAEAVGALTAALRARGDEPPAPWIATLALPFAGWPTAGSLPSQAGPQKGAHAVGAWREFVETLHRHGIAAPVWIRNTPETAIAREQSFLGRLLEASVLTGALLCDGIGDLVSIETESDPIRATKLAYNVLQGAGARISKTEFVACPSCGRTLFDLQTTTQRIREKTGHLKGVKIAIMGCIVNGPGEMADADFGYVAGAPGRINLYVGKNCVQYNIPQAEADQRLIDLIREHGKWFDPEPAEVAPA